MKTLVIIPTYNESDNIISLIKEIREQSKGFDICVVDDNSPDGTAKLVDDFVRKEECSNIFLINRMEKSGRGDAVRAGLVYGVQSSEKYEAFVEMDSDFSHNPKYLKEGLNGLKTNDVILGSRYPDGGIVGWPLSRKILSLCSNLLIRFLLKWDNADYTNGFRFYNRRAAVRLCSVKQEHKGYIYLSETLAILIKEGYSLGAFPIIFVNRVKGKSNTSFKEIQTSLFAVFEIAYKFRFGSYKTVEMKLKEGDN